MISRIISLIKHFLWITSGIYMNYKKFVYLFQGYHRNGNIFTLFLHSPLTALCLICKITALPIHHWERCQLVVNRFISEASTLFTRSTAGKYLNYYFYYLILLLLVTHNNKQWILENELLPFPKFQSFLLRFYFCFYFLP